MSQAFVKETDPADELPDREISPHPNYVTAEGLALIEARVAEFQRDYAAAQAGSDPEQIDRPRLANWKQFKGEIKKHWGQLTDDDLTEIDGNREKLEGKLQERYGKQRDEVRKQIDSWTSDLN